jgi:hypothetical protein
VTVHTCVLVQLPGRDISLCAWSYRPGMRQLGTHLQHTATTNLQGSNVQMLCWL